MCSSTTVVAAALGMSSHIKTELVTLVNLVTDVKGMYALVTDVGLLCLLELDYEIDLLLYITAH